MSALGDSGSRTSRLGRYELITRIGEGGMAEVQLALQRGPAGFEKLVVVKLVHASLATHKDFVDMLLDEARLAALLKHPNIVDIYDLGEVDGRFFIAMEYLEGEPLLAVLRAGREGNRLDPMSTARLIADTAEGLDAAHELRSMAGDPLELVHHDVSLGNIVVLYNGQAKLVDFGVAKATQSVSTSSRVQGKFSYMAPEKLRGGRGDRRSDLWSLGCVLWEALTLRRLFKGSNDHDTMRQVLDAPIPIPSHVNGDVVPAFDAIVLRALQRDPALRYPTAKAMAIDLEEVLRTHGYGGKNDQIAKYMQSTFAAHIAARRQLLQEVSSKGRASADVVEAAFHDPMLASGSPIHSGEFSVRFRPPTGELRPPSEPRPGTGSTTVVVPAPARADGTPVRARRTTGPGMAPSVRPAGRLIDPFPQQAAPAVAAAAVAVAKVDYPRAKPADLPPIVVPFETLDEATPAPTVARRLPTSGVVLRKRPGRSGWLVAAAGLAIATVVVIVVVARRGGGGAAPGLATPPPEAGRVANRPEPPAPAPSPAPESPAARDDIVDATGRGSGDYVIELPPERVVKAARPVARPTEDPAALYKTGLNAFVLGDLKSAMAHFKRALAASPGFAIAWRGIGMVHERLGENRAATAAFQRYLQLNPSASDAAAIRAKLAGPK